MTSTALRRLTLGVITDAVMYLAHTDGYLSQRFLYIDSRWLADLAEDELDDEDIFDCK